MNSQFKLLLAILYLLTVNNFTQAQELYFPPINNSTWETISPESLGWSAAKIDTLYSFLEDRNSKAFIVLKDGKIVLEKYFGTFTGDSSWYWASAGKSLTSFLIGKAQEDGYLSISDTTSKYLGTGWTSCTLSQENKITIRHQLTMTTGLDDNVPDNNNTEPSSLVYLADAGSRWAYHTAPYTLLEKVIENSTGQSANAYTQNKIKSKTGMTGAWYTIGFDNVFISKARSMARFGLLMQNKCVWNTDTLLYDTDYINQMTATSQDFNKSYGYLWWLNGKSSYMVPSSQIVFSGDLAPHAPADMFAALGKNGQIASVSRSKSLVVVRMGNAPNGSGEIFVPWSLCDQIWEKLNDAMNSLITESNRPSVTTLEQNYPNPFNPATTISYQLAMDNIASLTVYNSKGELVETLVDGMQSAGNHAVNFNAAEFSSGVYFYQLKTANQILTQKMILCK